MGLPPCSVAIKYFPQVIFKSSAKLSVVRIATSSCVWSPSNYLVWEEEEEGFTYTDT